MIKKTNRNATKIRAGDTSNIYYMSPFADGNGGASNLSNTAYTCRTVVVAALGDAPIIDKTITNMSTDLMYFQVVLEPADTALLAEGNYIWVTEVNNAVIDPIFRKEKHIDLAVLPQGIT